MFALKISFLNSIKRYFMDHLEIIQQEIKYFQFVFINKILVRIKCYTFKLKK